MAAGLFCGLYLLLGWVFCAVFFGLPFNETIYSFFGAALFCGFIVFDTYRSAPRLTRKSNRGSAAMALRTPWPSLRPLRAHLDTPWRSSPHSLPAPRV